MRDKILGELNGKLYAGVKEGSIEADTERKGKGKKRVRCSKK
jgi:hypothetical protein